MFYFSAFNGKDMGININDINPDHLPAHIMDQTTRDSGLKINFVECSIDRSTKDKLFSRLKGEYGAVDIESHEGNLYGIITKMTLKFYSHTVPPHKLDEGPNYSIVKITVHNEVGSLNRILKAFRVSIRLEIASSTTIYDYYNYIILRPGLVY